MARAAAVTAALLAGLLGPLPTLAQCPAPPPAELTVRGSGTVDRRPDLAELTITVLTLGTTLEGTSRVHEARIAEATAALNRIEAEGASVDQGSFGLTEDRSAAAPGVRPAAATTTYRAETRYDLEVRAVDKIDVIVASLVATGLFQVDTARFTIERKGDALDQARRAAMEDAKRQADVYADAGGVRLDGIARITDGDAGGAESAFEPPVRMAAPSSVGLSPPKVLHLRGDVTVTWRIAPR